MKRKGCKTCMSYSYAHGRCLKGQANPVTKRGTEEVANLMGWSYICMRNVWKDEKVTQMIAVKN